MDAFKYIFGPVPSRRLGLSLGVDIVPLKTCSLSCRYCQVGETPVQTLERGEYINPDAVLRELEHHFSSHAKPDWVTFSGSGEPTLNSGIGYIISGIKRLTDTPVCVITNGTLLWMPEVREALLTADAVMPSLDSALNPSFHRLCNPHPDLDIDRIIDGLVAFRQEYKGQLWLEILFADGINDSNAEVDALVSASRRISPDSIHLNTVVRPPADSSIHPVKYTQLERFRERFGENVEIIASFDKKKCSDRSTTVDEIREYLKRRPVTVDDLASSIQVEKHTIQEILNILSRDNEIQERFHSGTVYWEYIQK